MKTRGWILAHLRQVLGNSGIVDFEKRLECLSGTKHASHVGNDFLSVLSDERILLENFFAVFRAGKLLFDGLTWLLIISELSRRVFSLLS